MKKRNRAVALIVAAALCVALTACAGDPPVSPVYTLNQAAVELKVGGTFQLAVTAEPETELQLSYESKNADVATVSGSGLITAVAPGSAEIAVTANGTALACTVTVKPYAYTLNETALSLTTGKAFQLSVTADPQKAVAVTYASDREEVATVSADGLVTAVAPGTALVTATADGKDLFCTVTVTAPQQYALNETAAELEMSETLQLRVETTPHKEVTPAWASSDEGVATVSAAGLVTPQGVGAATITASVDGKELACAVTVVHTYRLEQTELTVKRGTAAALGVSITPAKPDAAISYESSNAAVAAVDADGTVTGIAPGTATISVTADGKAFECLVEVTPDATATAASAAAEGTVYLTDADDTLDTLYWEHYGWDNVVNCALNAEDLITDNTIEGVTQYFNDYKADINWSNGSVHRAWYKNHDGRCATENVTFRVKVGAGLTELRIYTGAWKATNTTKVTSGGAVLAAAQAFTAGDASVNTVVTFRVTAEAEQTITVSIAPSEMQEGGNVSLVAVAVLGTRAEAPAVTATVAGKTEMTGHNDCKVNLTEKGALDWYYLNYEHEADEKTGADLIKADTLNVQGNGEFWDYKAAFKWTDGTKYPTSPVDDDCDNAGTNNGKCGAYVSVDVAVTAETRNVYLWVGGYSACEYYVEAVDSAGNVVLNTLVGTSAEGQTLAYEMQIGIQAEKADTLTFIVYRVAGINCSLAAVAVA